MLKSETGTRFEGLTLHRIRLRPVVRSLFLALLFLALLLNGSVATPYRELSICLALVPLLLSLMIPVPEPEIRRLRNLTLGLIGAAALWGLLQAAPLPLWMPVHPIWRAAAPLLDLETGALSVAPQSTVAALPSLVLPGLIFICSLVLSQSVTGARQMWYGLAVIGSMIVVISFVLELAFADAFFFSEYEVGYGTFSGVFVNRNIAASAFVLTAFALAGVRYFQAGGQRSKKKSAKPQLTRSTVLSLLMLLLTGIAILATQSRAGTLLSFPLLCLCLGISEASKRGQQKLVTIMTVLAVGSLIVALFGEPVFGRLEAARPDARWCAWSATMDGIRSNFWTGTGYGTFIDAFPAHRDPSCLTAAGTWHRAHNGFLELAFGFGVPAALLFFGAGYAILGHSLLTGLRRRKSLRAIPILCLGLLAYVSAHSMVDFPMQIPGVAWYFAALMGVGCATSLQ